MLERLQKVYSSQYIAWTLKVWHWLLVSVFVCGLILGLSHGFDLIHNLTVGQLESSYFFLFGLGAVAHFLIVIFRAVKRPSRKISTSEVMHLWISGAYIPIYILSVFGFFDMLGDYLPSTLIVVLIIEGTLRLGPVVNYFHSDFIEDVETHKNI